jgi:hydroxymethylpyrimidine pyrophosphatase-like HAD family hydrolase
MKLLRKLLKLALVCVVLGVIFYLGVVAMVVYRQNNLPPVGEYTGGNVYQACVYINDQETAMLDPVRGKCVITRWHPNAVDIIAPDGGKRAAVEQYCRDNGWAREEIIAFGDSDNDLEMIRYAGIGVALGNAEPEVKAAADYVTADIDDDGLAKALEHFGLI